nr:hypothetical protein [Geomonas agri]
MPVTKLNPWELMVAMPVRFPKLLPICGNASFAVFKISADKAVEPDKTSLGSSLLTSI